MILYSRFNFSSFLTNYELKLDNNQAYVLAPTLSAVRFLGFEIGCRKGKSAVY
jgi:hypothetical protein